jgi:hypothetical protein
MKENGPAPEGHPDSARRAFEPGFAISPALVVQIPSDTPLMVLCKNPDKVLCKNPDKVLCKNHDKVLCEKTDEGSRSSVHPGWKRNRG